MSREMSKMSFWDGQPVTAPVYPQMGDIQQINPHLAGCGSRLWPGVASTLSAAMQQQYHQATGFSGGARAHASRHGSMSMQAQGMGDFRHVACSPMPASFCGHHSGQFESCMGNGEAFCAYNGMDTSIQGGRGANGDFW